MLVFISHNRADKNIAREIGIFLVSEGINVWFDEWNISAGDSITEKINEGLTDCDYFLILWSINSDKSDWVRRELFPIISRAISSGVPKIIPIKLDETLLPAMLNDILYIEYTGGDENDRRKIIEAVTNRQPSQNLIRAIVKKYNEVIYDLESKEPMPIKVCPMCGCEKIKKYEQLDYRRDDMYYFAECTECEWSDWTQ